jgi:hypothetical protein
MHHQCQSHLGHLSQQQQLQKCRGRRQSSLKSCTPLSGGCSRIGSTGGSRSGALSARACSMHFPTLPSSCWLSCPLFRYVCLPLGFGGSKEASMHLRKQVYVRLWLHTKQIVQEPELGPQPSSCLALPLQLPAALAAHTPHQAQPLFVPMMLLCRYGGRERCYLDVHAKWSTACARGAVSRVHEERHPTRAPVPGYTTSRHSQLHGSRTFRLSGHSTATALARCPLRPLKPIWPLRRCSF